MSELIIRRYLTTDRQAVFRIGADTAFFGEPIEAYIEDRNLFLDAFYAYYTDLEPEHIWLACADGEVTGFLTGCTDTRLHDRKFIRVIFPRLSWNLLRGKYHFGKRSLHYIGGLLGGLLHREYTHVNLNIYPAHLHINVEAAWRGYNLGQRLMEAYLDQLRDLGIKGVHLDTTSMNKAACQLYEKMGFLIQETRPDRFWEKWFGQPVENLCYGLILN
jgi:ribosomal protein S18 acetylase RimI-like enzyme